MPPAHWLVKSEPSVYSWDRLVDDRRTLWDGVRNYEARNNLRAMRVGDLALYYHSGDGPEVVGVARIVRESYPDPTSDEEAWVVVDVEPLQRLERSVALAAAKAEPRLRSMQLITRGRISVVPVTPEEFACVLALGATELREGAVPEKLPPRSDAPRKAHAEAKPAAKRARKAAKKKRTAGKKSTKKKSSPTRRRGRAR